MFSLYFILVFKKNLKADLCSISNLFRRKHLYVIHGHTQAILAILDSREGYVLQHVE